MFLRMILKILSKYAVTVACVLFTSCNINGTYENRESDKDDGQEIVREFYGFLGQGDFMKTYALYTHRFFTITDTSKLEALYVEINLTCGRVKEYTLINWKTTIVKGTNPISEYIYSYDVSREKCKTRETLLLKQENDKIRIASYDVQMY